MRNIIIFLITFIIIGCSNKVVVSFYSSKTNNPKMIIDSIGNSEGIYIKDYSLWEYNYYISNDSVIIKQYVTTIRKKNILHIMSVTGIENDSIYLFKYSKE